MKAVPDAPGLTFAQFVAGTGVTARTLRRWIAAGLLDPPVLRGPKTVYPAAQRARVQAIARLRDEGLRFDAIRARLAAAPEAVQREPAAAVTEPAAAVTEPPGVAGEAWTRVQLLHGLELHLRTDAGELVRRIAAEIAARYGAKG